jgi:gas vesicle protein
MQIISLITLILAINNIHSECLSKEVIEALGLTALDSPEDASGSEFCKKFFADTNAKACVSFDNLSDIVGSKTEEFAKEFSETQVKVLSAVDSEIPKFAEARKKIDESGSSFSSEIKANFDEAKIYIDKYTADAKKLRDSINKCNLAQQTISFGSFCLYASDMASNFVENPSVNGDGGVSLTLKVNPSSANKMAEECADVVKNTCLALEIEKAMKSFDSKDFASDTIGKCTPDFMDCLTSEESGSGCADSIKQKLFTDFSTSIGSPVLDEKTKELFDSFSSDASDLYDKLEVYGFGTIKEGAEGTIQGVKGFLDNFVSDAHSDAYNDAINDAKDALNDAQDSLNDSGIKIDIPNPFRILEANNNVSYSVSEDGYDCYSNGADSNFKLYNSIEMYKLYFMYGLFSIFVFIIHK